MTKTIGCIGCGNMGGALLRGFANTLSQQCWRLLGYDTNPSKMNKLKSCGIISMSGIPQLANEADIIIFAVKPQYIDGVLTEAQVAMKKNKIAVSIAAGISLATLRAKLGLDCKIARCMPTTTALVGKGIFAFCFDPIDAQKEWEEEILHLFGNIGLCQQIPEAQFTAYTALIGAGPAYIFQIMQAFCQAGVTLGFQHNQCRQMITELLSGVTLLAQEKTDAHLSSLRDDVCSPGGVTIAGINYMERAALSGIIIDAVLAAHKRGNEMEK